MTTMTRFVAFSAPLEDVAVLQNRLNSIFHDFAMPSNGMETESLDAGNFVPAVDIYEDSHRLLLKLEAPDIRQEDLDIRVENQTLTVKGERKFAQDEKEENFHHMERPNCRYRESLEERVRDAVAHEKELESKLPEPQARKEALEQVERASNDLREHIATCNLCCKPNQ
jgi:HSP20 family molecular chaperone IbpA